MSNFITLIKENFKICKTGQYVNIDIKNDIRNAISNSEYILLKNFKYNTVDTTNKDFKYIISKSIIDDNTVDASIKAFNEYGGNVIALNFASAVSPGGGYVYGATTQEECLCRASTLYPCLTQFKSHYIKNMIFYTPIFKDYLIYSPCVPVFRNNDSDFLDKHINISFITCPAVNNSIARFFYSKDKIENVMKDRIEFIIKYALTKNPSVLILGAFGCGVFKNDRNKIYNYFEDAINKYVNLDKTQIVFAVPINNK